MGKALGWVFLCLVAGAGILFWLQTGNDVPGRSSGTSFDAAWGGDPGRENVELKRRVAALEEQMSRYKVELDGLAQRVSDQAVRTDSDVAASAAAIRQLGQRPVQVDNNGVPFGVPVPVTGARAERLTVESVEAAAARGQPLNAPMNLNGVEARSGQVLVFKVTGTSSGTVWGSDVYTDDSSIAAAAVHGGAVRPGETGTIMLTIRPGNDSYPALARNGIESRSFGAWGRSFVIQRLY